jgi:hypothetical protein
VNAGASAASIELSVGDEPGAASSPPPGPERVGLIAWLAALYLLGPLVPFAAFWLAPLPAVLLLAGIAAALFALGRPERRDRAWVSAAVVAGVAALGWALMSGVIGSFALPTFDWAKHIAILGELQRSKWPTSITTDAGDTFFLRYYLAWYLPPALVGKVLGQAWMLRAAELWTALGAGLAIALVIERFRTIPARVAAALGFVAFSGLDVLGGWVTGWLVGTPRLGDFTHLEIWSMPPYEYSSHTTSLLWVPQHAIGAWLGVLLVLEACRRRRPALVPVAVFAVLFWSPFAALGVLPFAVVGLARMLRDRVPWRRVQVLAPTGAMALASLVLIAYLTAASGNIPSGWAWDAIQEPGFPGLYLLFVLFEVGLLFGLALLVGVRAGWIGWTALASLAVFPLVTYGDYNDLVRRASIAGLAVLAILVLRAAFDPAVDRGRRFVRPARVLLWVAIGFAAVTPVVEMKTRVDLADTGFRPFPECRLELEACSGVAPGALDQYLAPRDDSRLDWLLR